ncbi:helix-turn-helix domain-containing protein [Actinokineospora spheciospongiae]|uniref:helix-turn-helix domain-containing protein n=1 Tax=Actinokineospora spheciospongiae TaxID=909613 RepID=UPI0015E84A28|nr:Scr1 family TA system antitoxin-like transcriptional regulator [Actinokineospora spheciospongiae]
MNTTSRPQDNDLSRAKTLRGLLLARELDEARRARGFSTRDLAQAMSMSPAMVNRVMTGRRVPTALEIGGLCAVLDVPAARRPVLYERRATADRTEWIIHPGGGRTIVHDVEAIADAITWFASDLIPRPLRTAAYDRAVEQSADPRPGHQAALRISRFLLHPRVLRHPALTGEVLRDQLHHLLDAHLPRIRLLPGSTAPHPGFRVLNTGHFPPIVHIEQLGTDLLLENPTATARHAEFLRHLDATALTTPATRDTLRHLLAAGGA